MLRFEKDWLGKDLSWQKKHEYDDGLVLIDSRERAKGLSRGEAGGRWVVLCWAGGVKIFVINQIPNPGRGRWNEKHK